MPATVDAKDYALARSAEISALTREIEQSKYATTRRAFQTLPRHMRRRAASYNVKRLPIRLRLRALEEVSDYCKEYFIYTCISLHFCFAFLLLRFCYFISAANAFLLFHCFLYIPTIALLYIPAVIQLKNDPHKGPSNKHVRNCRRWRRRPKNLHDPAITSKPDWLPTHLWHAKRCAMTSRWGFKIALGLNEKCLRSSVRAFRSGALMWDASYWRGFELSADEVSALPLSRSNSDNDNDNDNVLRADYLGADSQPLFPVVLLGRKYLFIHPAVQSVPFVGQKEPLAVGLFCLFGGGLPTILPAVRDGVLAASVSATATATETAATTTTNTTTAKTASIFESKCKKECFIVSEWDCARALWYTLVKIKPIKVCGLQVLEHLSCELSQPSFPRDYPCSPEFPLHWSERIDELTASDWSRKPPAKRPSQPPRLPTDISGFTRQCAVRIVGRGVVQERAEILLKGQAVGFVTAALTSSLMHGCSCGLGVVAAAAAAEGCCEIRNPNGVIRKASIKLL